MIIEASPIDYCHSLVPFNKILSLLLGKMGESTRGIHCIYFY